MIFIDNQSGQLGLQTSQETNHSVSLPKQCSYNILVKSVACGPDHTHLLSQSGYLYSMGSNRDGRLGLGLTYQQLQYQRSPRLVESLNKLSSVSTSIRHSLAIGGNENQCLYGWGSATDGAIGRVSSGSLSLTEVCVP